MKYYVLGYDYARVVILTSRVFESEEEATKYASGCGSAWRAFVVRSI